MNVIILDEYRAKFERLCADFDTPAATGKPIPVQVMPGVRTLIHTHEIPDQSQLATWIALHYPEWISNTWEQVQQSFFKPH